MSIVHQIHETKLDPHSYRLRILIDEKKFEIKTFIINVFKVSLMVKNCLL